MSLITDNPFPKIQKWFFLKKRNRGYIILSKVGDGRLIDEDSKLYIYKINLMSTTTQSLEAMAASIKVKDCISISLNTEVYPSFMTVPGDELWSHQTMPRKNTITRKQYRQRKHRQQRNLWEAKLYPERCCRESEPDQRAVTKNKGYLAQPRRRFYEENRITRGEVPEHPRYR